MKELSIKEKADRYDEALKKIKMLLGTGSSFSREELEFVFSELKESEDEKIRKWLITTLKSLNNSPVQIDGAYEMMLPAIAWLEKQGEHANFRNKIQIGDKVTRNEGGVLVNISQLNRVAKERKKQGEQKPADKVEPKFKVGDWITNDDDYTWKVTAIKSLDYVLQGQYGDIVDCAISYADNHFHLWTIQDAKDGDVLYLQHEGKEHIKE